MVEEKKIEVRHENPSAKQPSKNFLARPTAYALTVDSVQLFSARVGTGHAAERRRRNDEHFHAQRTSQLQHHSTTEWRLSRHLRYRHQSRHPARASARFSHRAGKP